MDVVALVLAGLSLLVAVLALFSSHSRANESNRLAREALAEARSSKVGDIWAAVIRSVNHRMTFNPTAEDAGPMLRDARADLMALVDALPEWGGARRVGSSRAGPRSPGGPRRPRGHDVRPSAPARTLRPMGCRLRHQPPPLPRDRLRRADDATAHGQRARAEQACVRGARLGAPSRGDARHRAARRDPREAVAQTDQSLRPTIQPHHGQPCTRCHTERRRAGNYPSRHARPTAQHPRQGGGQEQHADTSAHSGQDQQKSPHAVRVAGRWCADRRVTGAKSRRRSSSPVR